MFSLACNLTKNDAEFLPIEISSKKVRVNNMDFSARRNFVEKSMCDQHGFFDHQNYIEKSMGKLLGFFDH